MAVRPVYVVRESAPYFSVTNVEFGWNGGFAKVQKQKNIRAIHAGFMRSAPGKKVLEISSKSMQEGGEALSAFFLPKYVPALGKSVPVECVFQAGKVFQHGGPYTDLLTATPKNAKRDERLKNSGRLLNFTFDGKDYPLIPKTIYYDFIYINALFENPELAKIALEYDAFTDVEFNPDKSINCQAKAAATFVSLHRMGLIDKVKDFDSFLSLYDMKASVIEKKEKVKTACEPEKPKISICAGDTLKHKVYGLGKVEAVEGTALKVIFPEVGEKTLNLTWCINNCEILK